jgi:hypothetical protein
MPIDLLADENENRNPIDLLADEDESDNNNSSSKGFGRNLWDYEKSLGLGLAQGAGDIGASIGNYPADIYKHFTGKKLYHIPHPSLQQYYPEGKSGEVGSSIGESIGSFAGPGGIAFKALKSVNNPLVRGLVGSGTGGILGAASNEKDRLGGGLAGAAIGGGTALGSSLIQGLRSLTSSGLAKKLSADKALSKQLAKKEYGKLFSDVSERGIESIKAPKIDSKRIIEHSLPRYHEALIDFKNNPTVESAHWAQSDLGHLKRNLEKLDASRGLTSAEHKTYKEVLSAQDKIKKSMFSDELQNHPDLAERYNKLSHKYKETVIPYENLKSLRKFEEGKMLPEDLIDSLKNNKEFRATLMKKYPGIKINQLLKSKGTKLIGATGLGLLGLKRALRQDE